MDLLWPQDVRALMDAPEEPGVSLYMPTHVAGPEVRQFPIRLKNMLGEAEERLIEAGLRRREAQEILEPAAPLGNDEEFWKQLGRGLALFLSPSVQRLYRLPLDFDELIVVGERFHVKPLIPLLTGDGRFLVLAVSQNETRLLQGTRQQVLELELDIPQGLEDLLLVHRAERQLQWHTGVGRPSTGSPTRGGRRPAVFHGHGVGKEQDGELLRKYLRRIDQGIREALSDHRVPLVVAAAEPLPSMFREVSGYDGLVEEPVHGNPDELHPDELHDRAWAVMEPRFRARIDEARRRYPELASKDKAVAGVEDALREAHFGRVETLFFANGEERWGGFDPETGSVEFRDDPKPGDVDLLDLAATETLTTGGTVYAVEAGEVPGGREAAALLRY